ncbi:MAG: phytanoyl-CoA dioxygenase family protein [Paracoccaceae bacterium]
MSVCTEMERYLFDLNGYLLLENALSADEVAACNATYDTLQAEGSCPEGPVRVHDRGRQEGLSFQQLYEGGAVWESLIDHPSWFEKVVHFIGTDDPENFDRHHGPAFIDECFGTIRGKGGALRLHSGGHTGAIRTQYRFHAGKFHCGQVNILIALTDIGPGDGATMVIPGSHKSNIAHPETVPVERRGEELSTDGVAGAVEVHMKKGDAILFVDAIMHGSARRTNDGDRRVAVYRYGPSWGYFRHKYRPSAALLDRLTERQRKILNPHV